MRRLMWLLFFAAMLGAQDVYFPPNSDEWLTIDPRDLGWNESALPALQDFLAGENTKAFLILKDGRIAVEWYFDNFTEKTYWYWASAGKTITAMLVGMAREQGYLDINEPTRQYLGEGWTALPPEQEEQITIWHQLTMTSGLDDGVEDNHCTLPECLQFKAAPGSRWAYHNAPYTLLGNVLEAATGTEKNEYTRNQFAAIGMDGMWIPNDDNSVYWSTPRGMARFGLLVANNGIWAGDTLLADSDYINAMLTPSQDLNPSYGYLWWLNGQGSYMLPGIQFVLDTDLIPSAPADLAAGLGKNDQKLYIVKSRGLVVVRLGNSAYEPKHALSSFDTQLWELISAVLKTPAYVDETAMSINFNLSNYPNPFNNQTIIRYQLRQSAPVLLDIINARGRLVQTIDLGHQSAGMHRYEWKAPAGSGVYIARLHTPMGSMTRKMLLID